jgi:hypothetical protein
MTSWRIRIRDAWSNAAPPGDLVLRDGFTERDLGAQDIQKWLSGKKWDEIASDDHQMEVEMPLSYLSKSACCYFLGGYLLYLAEAFEDGCTGDLAPIHFASFLGSERLAEVLPALSPEQRATLRDFAAAMFAKPGPFGLDGGFLAALESGYRLLSSGGH